MAKILIVDDDMVLLTLLDAALKKEGHSCVLAPNAFDALEKIRTRRFDLIVCDVNMPGYSGYSLAETVRADEKLKDIPLLFLTGRREKKDVIRAKRSGADDYLIKPVEFSLLFPKVEALLKGRHKTPPLPDVMVQIAGQWNAQLTIFAVSERGVSFRCDAQLAINMKLKVESDLYQKIGIAAPHLAVITCMHDEKNNSYLIKAAFSGIDNTDSEKIKKWVADNQPQKSQKVS